VSVPPEETAKVLTPTPSPADAQLYLEPLPPPDGYCDYGFAPPPECPKRRYKTTKAAIRTVESTKVGTILGVLSKVSIHLAAA